MSRYIDTDELIFFGLGDPDDENFFEFVPKEFIDKAPIADVVEVVRCKDCRYLKEDRYCKVFSADNVNNYGFCSYGERIENAEVH